MKGKTFLRRKRISLWRDQSGGVAVITAVLLVVLVGFVALAVDVGHLMAVRNELQNSADAAALAGTRALFPPVAAGVKYIPVTDPPYCSLGVTAAVQFAAQNKSDQQSITMLTSEALTGHWGWPGETAYALNTFTPNASCSLAINGVSVTTRRDSTANLPVTMWFAQVLGTTTANVRATATAAVGYVKGLPPGTGFPIAINQTFLGNLHGGPGTIYFSPDNADQGAWCGPTDYHNINANLLKNWINNGLPEGFTIGDAVNLINGNVDSAFQDLQKALTRNSQNWDGTVGWLVLMPVVTVDKFNQSAAIVEFQPMVITEVQSHGNPKYIKIKPYNDPLMVGGAESGGPVSQLYATQPKLVQ
jgi:hypothetical protein